MASIQESSWNMSRVWGWKQNARMVGWWTLVGSGDHGGVPSLTVYFRYLSPERDKLLSLKLSLFGAFWPTLPNLILTDGRRWNLGLECFWVSVIVNKTYGSLNIGVYFSHLNQWRIIWLFDDAIQSPSFLQPSVLPPLVCWLLSSCLIPHGCKMAAVAPGIMSTQQARKRWKSQSSAPHKVLSFSLERKFLPRRVPLTSYYYRTAPPRSVVGSTLLKPSNLCQLLEYIGVCY